MIDFNFSESEIHNHMAAIITDGILQAGLNYNTVVKPKIDNIKLLYPELKTTSAFYDKIQIGELEKIINWKHEEKLNRIIGVTKLFIEEHIETPSDLAIWLSDVKNVAYFKTLRGVSNKTADYFKILTGKSSVAVDRHLFTFLNLAGIKIASTEYERAKKIIIETAILMNKRAEILDFSIWTYMTNKK